MHAGRIIMCGCTGAKGLHTGEVYLPFDALVIGPRLEVLDLARLGVRDDPQHIREACAAIATLAGLQHERVEPLLRKFIQQGAAGGCHQRRVEEAGWLLLHKISTVSASSPMQMS